MIKTGLTATFIATFIMAAIAFWAMGSIPSSGEIPVHWNIKGEADRFVSPEEARLTVWIFPAVSILVGSILALAVKIDPRKTNLEKSRRAYLAIWIGTMILMTFVTALVCYSMVNGENASQSGHALMPKLITVGISVLLIVMGNYLPKTRSNWFFGVRTPWTLSSEQAWEKTHRFSGRLFILLGVIGLISIFVLPADLQIGIIVVGSIAVAILSVVYSFLAWRKATDRSETPDYVE